MDHVSIGAAPLDAQPLFYRAFGLCIRSTMPLPELARWHEAFADVNVYAIDDLAYDDVTSDEPTLESAVDTVVMSFAGVGRFVVRPAERSISIHACKGQMLLARLPLLGPVMAAYLHLTGQLVLHASAITARAGTFAFLGDKGAGKSTTAAAFICNGAKLVTDDLLVCSPPRSCWPAFSQVKLTEDAYQALRLDADDVPSPHPLFGKRQQRLPSGDLEAVQLNAIGVLKRDFQLQIERLEGARALEAILRFAYVLRYGTTFLSGRQGAEHFQRCAALVRTTPVFMVSVPHDLERLPTIAGKIDDLLSQQLSSK